MQEQIDDLQSRLSFQEDLLNTLNDGFAKQQLMIDRIEHKMTVFEGLLGELVKAASQQGNAEYGDEPPPHY